MVNTTNLLGNDKTRWPIGNSTETKKLLVASPAQLAAGQLTIEQRTTSARTPFRIRVLCASAWLARTPRGLGAWLFQRNDAEANWRNWQITEIRGGLARGYRDSRFDVLRQLHDLLAQHSTEPSDE